jgi:hypothetical protein
MILLKYPRKDVAEPFCLKINQDKLISAIINYEGVVNVTG